MMSDLIERLEEAQRNNPELHVLIGQTITALRKQDKRIAELEPEKKALEIIAPKLSIAIRALESIKQNSCCEPCKEAGLVANEALTGIRGNDDRT
jgi:glucose-6-phosphate-specific signal transduction histidine kinase